MMQSPAKSRFTATLLRPAEGGSDAVCAFVLIPKETSAVLPRRGRTTVEGTIDGHGFQVTLEPDGQLGHWMPISTDLLKASGANIGNIAVFEIMPVSQEPEPEVPSDFQEALAASPAAISVWDSTTTIARLDWIHWITSAKQDKTRIKRIHDACDKLASGERRVCCFDVSGYYSKAFGAPKTAD